MSHIISLNGPFSVTHRPCHVTRSSKGLRIKCVAVPQTVFRPPNSHLITELTTEALENTPGKLDHTFPTSKSSPHSPLTNRGRKSLTVAASSGTYLSLSRARVCLATSSRTTNSSFVPQKGCAENGPAAALFVGYVSIQICARLTPYRRPILNATICQLHMRRCTIKAGSILRLLNSGTLELQYS
jgi:hypothetical protein